MESTSYRRDLMVDVANIVALLGDAAMAVLGLLLGFWIRFRSQWIPDRFTHDTMDPPQLQLGDYGRLIGVGALFLMVTFVYLRLYETRNLLSLRRVTLILLRGTSFWVVAFLGINLALKFEPTISRGYVFSSYLACLVTIGAWRWIFHSLVRTEALARGLRQNIVFVGWNDETSRIANAILGDPTQPYGIVGCLPSSTGHYQEDPPPHIRRLGQHTEISEWVTRRAADVVVLADLDADREDVVALSNLCEREMVQFKVIPGYFQILISGLHLESISGVPIMGVSELPLDRLGNRVLKRGVDVIGSIVGLVLSAPLFAFFGLCIFFESPGPIFYRQVRTGRNGRNFEIIKLRSMRPNAEGQGGAQWATKDDPRRLRVGAFMREWNIDEIPQFWNVLIGDMSLVGPRPERPELIASFKHQIPHYNARHACKPGITGWAQVNGLRGNTSLVERVRYDLWYLENWSFWLDFQIMIQTFFRRDNAY